MQLDKVVMNVVEEAITIFRGDLATYVPQIFWAESAANQAEIQTWYANPQNVIQTSVGYPLESIVQPGIWAILQPAREPDEQELQGWGFTGVPGVYAIPMAESVALMVAAPNQNQVLWLQTVLKWACYTQRAFLENTYELHNQRLTASALTPEPDSGGDVIFPFRRVWTLSCWYYDQYVQPLTPITGASVTVEVTNSNA